MEDINRLCVFSFHKKSGEGVAISFVEMKGEKMRISLKEQRSGSDSEYEEITAFTVNVDNAFCGSVARNSQNPDLIRNISYWMLSTVFLTKLTTTKKMFRLSLGGIRPTLSFFRLYITLREGDKHGI